MTPEEAVAAALDTTYGFRFRGATAADWQSDAAYVLERVRGYSLVPTADLDRLRAVERAAREAVEHAFDARDECRWCAGDIDSGHMPDCPTFDFIVAFGRPEVQVHVNDGSSHDRAMAWSEGHTAGYDEAEAVLRDMLTAIPATGLVQGANRYDTDDKHVLHVWRDGVSWDIEVSRGDRAAEGPTVYSSSSPTAYLRDALDHWLRNGSSIEALDDLRTAAAEWLHEYAALGDRAAEEGR